MRRLAVKIMTEEASRTGTYVPQSDDDWPATHPLLAEYKAPPHVEEAWKYWESIGKPKYLLAPSWLGPSDISLLQG